MTKKTYGLLGLLLVVAASVFVLNFYAGAAAAQKADESENLGAVEYNARDEFSLTQGGTSGVWRYGYTPSDASNAFNEYTLTSLTNCGGGGAESWQFTNAGDTTPVISRYLSPATCNGVPTEALFVHPGPAGQRSVLRWVAPAAGTYQLTGVFQKSDPSATSDIRILKNAAGTGEAVFFTGSLGALSQHPFNFSVTVAAGDTLDFSVGYGNGTYNSDGSSLVVKIGPPVAACALKPADLAVWLPGENSAADVESRNANGALAGDAAYTNAGKAGRAFTLDGSGDYVVVPDNAAQRPANALTIEGWFKFDGTPGIVSLVSKPLRNSPFNSYSLYLDGGSLRGLVGTPSQYTRVFSNFTPTAGVWHHLAFTYDYSGGVSTLKLFANGVEVTTGQDGTANLPLFYEANPYPLLVGAEYENNAPGFYLNGAADEVSIYRRALTKPEIFSIVRAGSFGKCAPAAPCAAAPNDLISWYRGEENALDARSNNHGALQNGAAFQNAKVGQGFAFDGVDDFVAAPDSSSLDITGDLTIEAWVNPAQIQAGSATLVDKRDPSNNNLNYVLFLVNGELRFASRSNGGTFDENFSGVTLPAGTFSHVAVTIQNGMLRFYVNGVSSPALTAPATRSASTGRLIIGATETTGLSGFFNGSIDELSIYARALAASEIQSIYAAQTRGKCQPGAVNSPAGARGWWTADGDAEDFLGLSAAGILRGDAAYKIGRVGQSFSFDGAGDYVEIPDDADQRPASGAVSVEGWFRLDSLSNQALPHLVSKPLRNSPFNSYVVYLEGGVLKGGYGTPGQFDELVSGFAPRLGEWYHIAYTIDDVNNVHTLYVNGAPIVAPEATTLPLYFDGVDNALAPHPLVIGGEIENNNPQWQMQGQADEVSLYDRALTPNEVAALYDAGVAGKLKAKFVNVAPPVAAGTTKSARRKFSAGSLLLLPPATIELSDATVTFANVTSGGTVSQSGLDLALLPPLPSSVTATGLAYDIQATAGYQSGAADDVQVCFNVPALAALNFASLRILHLENGAWVNRSAAVSTSPVLCTDNLTSLSPFVIVQALAPTAASVSVSGRITDASGAALGGVSVSLTDSQGARVYARSNNFGRYSFAGVAVGGIYNVSVQSKRYSFTVSSQAVSVQDALENVDFTADSETIGVKPMSRETARLRP